MTCFWREKKRKLASHWFPGQKSHNYFAIGFWKNKANCDKYKFMIHVHKGTPLCIHALKIINQQKTK